MIEELYNKKETICQSNQKLPKNLEHLLNKQFEKIKTENIKINSYIGLKKVKNENNFVWFKITNSYASIDDTNGNTMPHILEGFYISVLNENDYLHIGFNRPLNSNFLTKILNNLNNLKEISIYDFLNYIQKNINRKADWLDKNF